ncbi:MAG TPA: SMC-Scp complex subunit ScpB, partial [Pseudomonas sp.]|nr:SMC-Scp complex subunit ScpB [Pseudomonas sp.]
ELDRMEQGLKTDFNDLLDEITEDEAPDASDDSVH